MIHSAENSDITRGRRSAMSKYDAWNVSVSMDWCITSIESGGQKQRNPGLYVAGISKGPMGDRPRNSISHVQRRWFQVIQDFSQCGIAVLPGDDWTIWDVFA